MSLTNFFAYPHRDDKQIKWLGFDKYEKNLYGVKTNLRLRNSSLMRMDLYKLNVIIKKIACFKKIVVTQLTKGKDLLMFSISPHGDWIGLARWTYKYGSSNDDIQSFEFCLINTDLGSVRVYKYKEETGSIQYPDTDMCGMSFFCSHQIEWFVEVRVNVGSDYIITYYRLDFDDRTKTMRFVFLTERRCNETQYDRCDRTKLSDRKLIVYSHLGYGDSLSPRIDSFDFISKEWSTLKMCNSPDVWNSRFSHSCIYDNRDFEIFSNDLNRMFALSEDKNILLKYDKGANVWREMTPANVSFELNVVDTGLASMSLHSTAHMVIIIVDRYALIETYNVLTLKDICISRISSISNANYIRLFPQSLIRQYFGKTVFFDTNTHSDKPDKLRSGLGIRTPFRDPKHVYHQLKHPIDVESSYKYTVEHGVVVHVAMGPKWRVFLPPRRRIPLRSVILDENVSEGLVTDVKKFIKNSQCCIDRGVPYRRGYLLYGPPGCGKTSFIEALASELGYSICSTSLSDKTLTDNQLLYLLNAFPLKSIIVLENIDAVVGNRDDPPHLKKAYEVTTQVTLYGLLNAISSAASSEGRILFMTTNLTNYVERLDEALFGDGRVDCKQFIGYCSDYQLKEMFRRFYTDADEPTAENFCMAVRQLNLGNVSPAKIQGHFLKHSENYQSAFDSLDDLVPKLQK